MSTGEYIPKHWAHNLLAIDADNIIFLVVKKCTPSEKISLKEGE